MLVTTVVDQRPARRGAVTPLVAICLVVIIGFVAIAVDGGVMLSERRQARSVADAAALAAAGDLYAHWSQNQGLDPNDTAKASALSVASANGYTNDGTTSTVTVHIPPTSGDHVGQAGYVEVITQYNQARNFGKIFGSGSLPVRGRSVGRGISIGGTGKSVIVLNSTTKNAFSITATATTVTVNGSIAVNSNNAAAMTGSGSGYVRAQEYDVTGGYTGGSSFEDLSGSHLTPNTGAAATPDPLSTLPYPDLSTLTVRSTGTRTVQSTEPQPVTLDPGVYGGISVQSGATAILNPGIYYMKGSGFAVSSASVTANGVLIYNGGTSSTTAGGGTTTKGLTITGGSTFTMSPMTSGTWKDITFFQERNSTPTSIITSGSAMNLTGTIYLKGSTVKVTGDSMANTHVTVGSQFICDIFNIAGGTFKIGSPVQSRDIRLVE